MLKTLRRKIAYPAAALGTGAIWCVLEFVALQRAALASRRQSKR